MSGTAAVRMLVLVALGVCCLVGFQGSHSAADNAPPAGADPLLAEVRQLRAEVAELGKRVARIDASLETMVKQNDQLISSRWEYRTEAAYGGATQARFDEVLAKMGKDRFEYVAQTADGLLIFRRRVVEPNS